VSIGLNLAPGEDFDPMGEHLSLRSTLGVNTLYSVHRRKAGQIEGQTSSLGGSNFAPRGEIKNPLWAVHISRLLNYELGGFVSSDMREILYKPYIEMHLNCACFCEHFEAIKVLENGKF
jgi:hypothetical protein